MNRRDKTYLPIFATWGSSKKNKTAIPPITKAFDLAIVLLLLLIV
jgi:hypothetical protein